MKKFIPTLIFWCIYTFPLFAQTSMPVLSVPHGIYEEPFSLEISSSEKNVTIYYTTDGSQPSKENGEIYTAPLYITTTCVLRAIAFDETTGVSETITATYLFLDDVLKQDNTPEGYPAEWGEYATRSGTAIADYEMDPEMTADADFCELLKKGFRSLPIVSIATAPQNLFNKEEDETTGGIYIYTGAPSGSGEPGRGWERPCSFELFDTQGVHDLQVNCGIKIHGGHSRLPEKSPKHSFRLVFREEFGPKKLKYPLFGKNEPSKLNAVVLRTAFCNSWHHQEEAQRKIAVYSRDMWAKRTQKEMGHLTTNGMYAHLFINGLYWGLYNPTERIDDDFCEAHLDDDKENFDVIKVEEYGVKHVVMADAGNMDKWNELFSLAEDAGDMTTYYKMLGLNEYGERDTAIEPLLNANNFIDYMLINYYGGNTDWDSHNWLAVRNRTQADEGFHFICWDSEHILKSTSENVLSKKTNLSPTYLFHKLMKNRIFKRQFIDRVQLHCFNNGTLTPQRGANRWLALDAVIDTALYCEQARWGDYRRDVHPYTKKGKLYTKEEYYDAQRDFLLNTYFPERTEAFISQLKEKEWFPNVKAPLIYYQDTPVLATDTFRLEEGVTLQGDGSLYYTINGEDPVSWHNNTNGDLSDNAIAYNGELITCNKDFVLKAIAYKDKEWSAIRTHSFVVQTDEYVGISSIMRTQTSIRTCYDQNSNPVLTYTLPIESTISISIHNLQGIIVSHPIKHKRTQAGTHHVSLPLHELQPGVYIGRLQAGDTCIATKLIIP